MREVFQNVHKKFFLNRRKVLFLGSGHLHENHSITSENRLIENNDQAERKMQEMRNTYTSRMGCTLRLDFYEN